MRKLPHRASRSTWRHTKKLYPLNPRVDLERSRWHTPRRSLSLSRRRSKRPAMLPSRTPSQSGTSLSMRAAEPETCRAVPLSALFTSYRASHSVRCFPHFQKLFCNDFSQGLTASGPLHLEPLSGPQHLHSHPCKLLRVPPGLTGRRREMISGLMHMALTHTHWDCHICCVCMMPGLTLLIALVRVCFPLFSLLAHVCRC